MIETLELPSLDDAAALSAETAGTKAANVARLRQKGFTVPPGWILSIPAAATWPSEEPAPPWLRAAVETAAGSASGPLAVRSSASWEDGTTTAHAGATTTVLNVAGVDAVLSAIRRCLDESELVRANLGASGGTAVLLQKMVQPDFAGVAFTADPLDGSRDVVRIAATEGLGDALVDGRVVGLDVSVRHGVVEGDTGSMTPGQLGMIADVASSVESLFGCPQDIEWALAGDTLHLLQARPITVLPVKPELPAGGGWQKDVAHYPEPMSPFGWSILHEVSKRVIPKVFADVGMLINGLEERIVGGEVYGRPIPAFGPADASGPPPPAWVLGLVARVVPELRRRNASARRTIESQKMERWVEDWHTGVRDWFVQQTDQLGQHDLAELSDRSLDQHFQDCVALLERGIEVHFQLFMPYAVALHSFHRFVRNTIDWDDANIFEMLVGQSPASRLSEDAIAPLRDRIRLSPSLAAALRANPRDPVQALNDVEPGCGDELRGWMDRHGWGCVNYDAGAPVVAERPAMVTKILLADVSKPDSTIVENAIGRCRDALPAAELASFETLLFEAQRLYPLRDENTIYAADAPLALIRRWMLEVMRRLIERGTLTSAGDGVYLTADELRGALRNEIDEQLTDRIGVRRGEEAYARANPGPAFIGEQSAMPDVSKLPKPLRFMNEPLLWAVSHEYPEPRDRPAGSEDSILVGVAAAPGVAVGPARVIRTHNDLDQLQDGDVLVCQITTPAWAPLFPIAAAVVADGGGALSHAAIAAREHGLPAVLGTGSATNDLVDGQMIRVDGTTGLVTCV